MAQFRQSGQHLHSSSSNGGEQHISIGIRSSSSSTQKPGRPRRSARSEKLRRLSFTSLLVVLSLVLLVTILTYFFLSLDSKDSDTNKPLGKDDDDDDDDTKNDSDFLTNVSRMTTSKTLEFGKGSVSHGGDSRYWDRDDRRRDEDYGEDDLEHTRRLGDEGRSSDGEKTGTERRVRSDVPAKGSDQRGVAFYNEDGRKELNRYEAVYEASLKNASRSGENGNGNAVISGDDGPEDDEVDEYDDSLDLLDSLEVEDGNHDHHQEKSRTGGGTKSYNSFYSGSKDQKRTKGTKDRSPKLKERRSHLDDAESGSHGGAHPSKVKSNLKRKPKRRSSCEMKFVNATQLVEPFQGGKFVRLSLQYVDKEENPNEQEQWEPRFAGHQSLQEREESFLVNDKKIHCGFVKGPEGSPSTGFDLTEDDTNYISKCHIAVISCIFGNSDRLRSPVTKMVSRSSRKNVCFVMFVDEITLATLSSENQMPDREGYIGLWKVVVVKNLPYTDMRRVGKVPKLLPHRLFPSARYSIWLDSKLRFQVDPLSVLEYFLWRKGYEYAISNHYDRHCVWEEVAQNKRLNKYNYTVIDEQFAFYQADGLRRFNASDPNKFLPSNVPEGSLIVRAHTPMSNLFSCLWFNEVDRFTSRDQLSFYYTYQKLRRMNPGKPLYLNMFKDCERRAIAKLFRHRSEEKRNIIHQEATG